MSELLEFLLEFVLDVVCSVLEGWAGWRFYVPFCGSLALIGMFNSLVSNSAACMVFCVPTLLAGVVVGLVWEGRASKW